MGAGIAGTTARLAWVSAYNSSPLFAWWAGGGANIIRTWGTRSLMGRIGGGLGLLGRVPVTPFAGAQISANLFNSIPGALRLSSVNALRTNAFLKDALINGSVYAASTLWSNYRSGQTLYTGLFDATNWSVAMLFGGLGGVANASVPIGWNVPARLLSYASRSALTSGFAYTATSFLNGNGVNRTGAAQAMIYSIPASPINLVSRNRLYFVGSGAAGIGVGVASDLFPW